MKTRNFLRTPLFTFRLLQLQSNNPEEVDSRRNSHATIVRAIVGLYWNRQFGSGRQRSIEASRSMAQLAASGDVNAPPARRVLVVDDEPSLREAVRYNLLRAGYVVEEAADGPEALARARATQPDLVILDVMLPGMDGLNVCRTLRHESDVPILLLSARGEELDRILGLELGADDYLTKPFAMRELLARVNANLRRVQMSAPRESDRDHHARPDPAATHHSTPTVITMGRLWLDPSRREAGFGDRRLILKPKEFDLLAYLMRHPGLVLSRDALLREVWGYDMPVDTRTIDVHISCLRQKLESLGPDERRIETVRGYGYRFVSGTR